MESVVKASTEGLIWLVVGIFWIIAQIVQSSAQKKKKEQQQRIIEGADPEESPGRQPGAPESFTELIRRLSGEQEPLVRPPEWIEEDELPLREDPAVPGNNAAAWSRSELDKLPDIEPVRRTPIPPLPALRKEPPVDAARHLRSKLSDFSTGTPIIKLPSIILRMSSPSRSAVSAEKRRGTTAPTLQGKKTLRRAMLGHIILGKPRALDPFGQGSGA